MDSARAVRAALLGQTVIVTRPLHQADELTRLLEAHAATVLRIPAIEIQPPASFDALDAALRSLATYQWAIFTSANAVEQVAARWRDVAPGSFGNAFRSVRVCAIGPATQAAMKGLGGKVDLVPEESIAESVVSAFEAVPMAGVRVLLPRAAAARDVVPDALRERGAVVDSIEVYRNGIPAASPSLIAEVVAKRDPVQWVTFTSGSTVKNFLAMGGAPLLGQARVATIGPATSTVARKHGVAVDAEAEEHTAAGLVEAIVRCVTGDAAGSV